MLLRLHYLAATNTLAFLCLLPMRNRDKDIEILVLGHQLLVLQHQVGKPAFNNSDRPVLADPSSSPARPRPFSPATSSKSAR